MTNFIDPSNQTSTISVYFTHSYRSKFSLKNFNHCFEATFNSGCNNFHIGISPFKATREFASFQTPNYFIEKLKSGTEYEYSNSIAVKQGDTIMSCINTKTHQIHSIVNEVSATYEYSHVSESRTWYAFFDATSSCQESNKANITVNFGMKGFVNDIPDGYKPLIMEYYIQRAKRYCTHTKTNHQMMPLISLLIFSS